jgi:hypothetical protein
MAIYQHHWQEFGHLSRDVEGSLGASLMESGGWLLYTIDSDITVYSLMAACLCVAKDKAFVIPHRSLSSDETVIELIPMNMI